MNNKIKFSLFILFVAATTSLVVLKMKKTENRFAEQNEFRKESEEDEKAEFEGSANWWNKMRVNQITHNIDIADIINARKEADLNLNNNNRSLSWNWEEMGPDNVGGRTRAILFDKANPSHVFSGGVSGGLWESHNYGQSWVRINGFDDKTIWNNQNISCITQADNGDIYVGTGEYFGFFETSVVGGGTGFPGDGIWKSTDHGATWSHVKSISTGTYTPTAANAWSFVTEMASGGASHPTRVYASIKGGSGVSSVQYTDNGTTWAACQNGSVSLTGLGADVEVSSNGTVHAIVGNKYYHSDPASSDPSTKFTSIGVTGLPSATSVVRMGVAVAPSNPNYVYVIASYGTSNGNLLKGVYQSVDGGTTFTQIAPTQISDQSVNWSPVTQGNYALAIGVSPSNENNVFIGGLDCYKYQLQSTGSYGWNKITRWTYPTWYSLYTHADIHSFIFNPANSDMMFVGSDGGLNMTTNANDFQPYFGTRNLGYNVTQFYSCDVREYSGIYVAGAQDNGNYLVDFTGNTTKTGVEIKSGDGGDVQVSKVNPLAIFAEYVNGSIKRSSNNGQSFQEFFDSHIDADPSTSAQHGYPDDGAAFISPMLLWEDVANQSNLNEYSKYYLGTNSGVWMTKQAMNFSITPAWFKVGVTTGGSVISLAVTPDGTSVFAGTEGGNVYRIDGLNTTYVYDSTTGFSPDSVGITTTLIHSFGGRYVTGISVDKSNANHIVVVLGNYGNTDYVYESNDALTTASFTNITGSGFPKMPVYCSAIDPTNPNIILIGTDLGIWATENGGSTWSEQNNSIGRVPVTKLRQLPVGNYLNAIYASTYGNGVWRTFSNSAVSVNEPKNSTSELKIYPNPASDEFSFVSQFSWGNTEVTANLIDINGKIVRSINYGKYSIGTYTFKINTSDLASGNYLLQVISGSKQSVSKVVIAK